jgi:hypothetical protein
MYRVKTLAHIYFAGGFTTKKAFMEAFYSTESVIRMSCLHPLMCSVYQLNISNCKQDKTKDIYNVLLNSNTTYLGMLIMLIDLQNLFHE